MGVLQIPRDCRCELFVAAASADVNSGIHTVKAGRCRRRAVTRSLSTPTWPNHDGGRSQSTREITPHSPHLLPRCRLEVLACCSSTVVTKAVARPVLRVERDDDTFVLTAADRSERSEPQRTRQVLEPWGHAPHSSSAMRNQVVQTCIARLAFCASFHPINGVHRQAIVHSTAPSLFTTQSAFRGALRTSDARRVSSRRRQSSRRDADPKVSLQAPPFKV